MKPRGRPEQLLQLAEIKMFIEYVALNKDASDLQHEAVDILAKHDLEFTELSEAHRLIVKEAYKPFREHLKIKSLAEHFKTLNERTAFEDKFLELYEAQNTTQLKAMATRYSRFKKNKEDEQALTLFLNQLEKKEKAKQRTAENRRKYELGGAVLSAYKKLNRDITEWTPKRVEGHLVRSMALRGSLWNTPLGKEINAIPETQDFFEFMMKHVITGLSTWSTGEANITNFEIKKALVLLEEHKAKLNEKLENNNS